MAVKTFCNDVVSIFTHCESVVALFTHCEQVWPTSSTVGAWYVKWTPDITSGQFSMFGSYYDFSKYSSIYRWNGLGMITEDAFAANYSSFPMEYMKTNVLSIESSAFTRCQNLQQISLPRCEYIGKSAFYACRSLYGTYKTVTDGHGYLYLPRCQKIDNDAFRFVYSTNILDAPVCSYIGASAFMSTHMVAMSLPECKYIGSYAFKSCNVGHTGRYVFNSMGVSLPVCSYIGSYAFQVNSDLKSVSLPKCSYVGSSAFESTPIRYLYLPVCSYIGSNAFVHYTWNDIYKSSTINYLNLPKCKYIGANAFFGHRDMTDLILPVCSYIGSSAFSWCVYLSNITVGSTSVCRLLNHTFNPRPDLAITVPSSLVSAYKVASWWSDYYSSIFPLGYYGSYNVNWTPADVSGSFNIAGCSLYFSSFSGSYSWTSPIVTDSAFRSTGIVTVSGNVTMISENAFRDCKSLTSANFPSCSVVDYSGFCGCSSLSTVSLPVCRVLGSWAFMSCKSLDSINLPSCQHIEGSTFKDCTALSVVSMSRCQQIYESAFYGCTALKSVSIPGCFDIGREAFYGCTALESIEIPMSSTTLGPTHWIQSSAFKNCTSLKYVSFGDVQVIESDAFYNCTELSCISVGDYIPQLNDSRALYGTSIWNGEGVIYIKAPRMMSSMNWSYFSSLMVLV